MADYLITYVGHLDILKARVAMLPDKIYDSTLVRVEDREGLVNAVNKESLNYIRFQGMSVRMNPTAAEIFNQVDSDRMFVPMHMITHITPEVRLLTGEMPIIDATGAVSLQSGKEIVKQ